MVAGVDARALSFESRAGRGPTLVCLHGSADNHHVYDRLVAALDGRSTVAIDLPGRAGCEGPPLEAVSEMEAFFRAFIEREVQGDYVVVGHSLGGGVAIEHALGPPEPRLRGLVLLATGARLRVHPMILELFDQTSKTDELPSELPGLYERDVDAALAEEAARFRTLTPIETGATDWRAADAFDRMRDLARVQVPTLVMAGTEDALTPPKYAHYLQAHIPNAELDLLEGAGHMFLMERAEEIAARIIRFLNGI